MILKIWNVWLLFSSFSRKDSDWTFSAASPQAPVATESGRELIGETAIPDNDARGGHRLRMAITTGDFYNSEMHYAVDFRIASVMVVGGNVMVTSVPCL